MRHLRVVRPCPTPEVVRGEHCDRCDTRVHDLTRSSDPAADVARFGGRACVRVLATALVLGGCSGSVEVQPPTTLVVPAATAQPDAGADATASPDDSVFLGEAIVD
jgi:hypothetical protein